MTRRLIVRLLGLAALAAAAGGCAVTDTGAFVRLQDEVVALKKDVARLKGGSPSYPAAAPAASSAAGRADAGDVSALQKRVADLTADSDQVKADLLAATTRADETKVQMQKEQAQLAEKLGEQGVMLQDQKAKLARLEEIERRISTLEEKVDKLQAAQGPASPSAPASKGHEWKSPEEMYDYALGLIKSGDPRKGREVLASFAAKYPGHKLTPNVLYWKGETYYMEKDYENAILAFQDVVDKYPSGDKASDAMLKQGLSFLALKDRKNARVLFELVQTKYPRTPAAEKARQKLAELK